MKKMFSGVMACLLAIALVLGGIMPMQAQATDKTDYSAVFDANYYYGAYPDLRSAIGNDKKALLEHFVAFGMKEGRHGNAEFDVKAYMENNHDLVQAFGAEDLTRYYLHYISYGKKEGRIAAAAADGEASAETDESTAVLVQNLISSYTTSFDPTQSRAINIELAVSKINGMVIQPGQRFSFSDSVGSRTAKNGYVSAPSFANGAVVQSVGGGICQVSSTMYAALLQGDIKVTQRYPHSKPVDYIAAGMDATIAAGTKDLTFINTFAYPLVIYAVIQDGTVTVSFGK